MSGVGCINTNTRELLLRAKERARTWVELERVAGVDRNAVWYALRKGARLSNTNMARLALYLGEPIERCIILGELDHADGVLARRFWEAALLAASREVAA